MCSLVHIYLPCHLTLPLSQCFSPSAPAFACNSENEPCGSYWLCACRVSHSVWALQKPGELTLEITATGMYIPAMPKCFKAVCKIRQCENKVWSRQSNGLCHITQRDLLSPGLRGNRTASRRQSSAPSPRAAQRNQSSGARLKDKWET